MSYQRYELYVRLRDIKPEIWRQVEIAGEASLAEVHMALQVAMGWTNSHLHQFVVGKKRYGMVNVAGAEDMELEDERAVRLQDVVKRGKALVYEYDFGDSWVHDVSVKSVTTMGKPVEPRCVAGGRACPPEDCGGVGGYENLLVALADPKHPEHGDLAAWVGDFDPERCPIPSGGIALREQMEQYGSPDDDDEDIELADVDDELVDGTDLPPQLMKAVLALEPLQRASLVAIVAASLAEELDRTRGAMLQLVGVMRRGATPTQRGHRTASQRGGKAKQRRR